MRILYCKRGTLLTRLRTGVCETLRMYMRKTDLFRFTTQEFSMYWAVTQRTSMNCQNWGVGVCHGISYTFLRVSWFSSHHVSSYLHHASVLYVSIPRHTSLACSTHSCYCSHLIITVSHYLRLTSTCEPLYSERLVPRLSLVPSENWRGRRVW